MGCARLVAVVPRPFSGPEGLSLTHPATFPGARGARGVRLVSHHGVRDEGAAGVEIPPAPNLSSLLTADP